MEDKTESAPMASDANLTHTIFGQSACFVRIPVLTAVSVPIKELTVEEVLKAFKQANVNAVPIDSGVLHVASHRDGEVKAVVIPLRNAVDAAEVVKKAQEELAK